jgi:hypothetical protein
MELTEQESADAILTSKEFPEALAKELLELPNIECPVNHFFGPQTYVREMEIPPGAVIVGHKHKYACVNIMLTGKMRLMVDGQIRDLEAPQILVSPAGSQKVAYIYETVRWVTCHQNPTDETDIQRVEESLFEPSAALLAKEEERRLAVEVEVTV